MNAGSAMTKGTKPYDVDVAIFGSGFGGLCMGIKLKEAGIDNFVILEKDEMYGGTWRVNHYPGAACDVPSHLYSFSFAQNAKWTRKFPPQQELWAYTQQVVREFKLEPHIRLNTALVSADFDEHLGIWRVVTSKDSFTAKTVVAATGSLSRPSIPKFPGIESFAGKMRCGDRHRCQRDSVHSGNRAKSCAPRFVPTDTTVDHAASGSQNNAGGAMVAATR